MLTRISLLAPGGHLYSSYLNLTESWMKQNPIWILLPYICVWITVLHLFVSWIQIKNWNWKVIVMAHSPYTNTTCSPVITLYSVFLCSSGLRKWKSRSDDSTSRLIPWDLPLHCFLIQMLSNLPDQVLVWKTTGELAVQYKTQFKHSPAVSFRNISKPKSPLLGRFACRVWSEISVHWVHRQQACELLSGVQMLRLTDFQLFVCVCRGNWMLFTFTQDLRMYTVKHKSMPRGGRVVWKAGGTWNKRQSEQTSCGYFSKIEAKDKNAVFCENKTRRFFHVSVWCVITIVKFSFSLSWVFYTAAWK